MTKETQTEPDGFKHLTARLKGAAMRGDIHKIDRYIVRIEAHVKALLGQQSTAIERIIQRRVVDVAERLNGVLCGYCGLYWPATHSRGTYDENAKLVDYICNNCADSKRLAELQGDNRG